MLQEWDNKQETVTYSHLCNNLIFNIMCTLRTFLSRFSHCVVITLWCFYRFAKMAPELQRSEVKPSVAAFLNVVIFCPFITQPMFGWKPQQNASVRPWVHQTAMVVNHCWTALACGGRLDGHGAGVEIFSGETFFVDWTDSGVCPVRAGCDADLQLCLVQGRHERCSVKTWGENKHARLVQM